MAAKQDDKKQNHVKLGNPKTKTQLRKNTTMTKKTMKLSRHI